MIQKYIILNKYPKVEQESKNIEANNSYLEKGNSYKLIDRIKMLRVKVKRKSRDVSNKNELKIQLI